MWCWLTKLKTEVVITKCLTTPLPGKVKLPNNCLHATDKTSIWSHNFSKTCIYYIYICTFVENLPLTKIYLSLLMLSTFFIPYLLIIWPSSHTTMDVWTFPKVWMFGKNNFDIILFIIFFYNVMWFCAQNYKLK